MADTDNAAMNIVDNLASNDGASATNTTPEAVIAPEAVAPKWLFYTGLLGMFAALVTGIGEFFLLYAPELNHGAANNYANFLHPSEADLRRGYYLSVIGAPFYIIGYWHIVGMLCLHKTKTGWAIMSLAVFGFMSGFAWLISNAYQGIIVQAIAASDGQARDVLSIVQHKIDRMSYPLLQVIRCQVFIMSAIFAITIIKHQTFYPRWIILCAPIILILLIFSSLLFIPSIGKYFAPEALNAAHFIFFSLSTAIAFRAYKRSR